MTDARVERVYPDRVTARDFVEQAEDFMRDAGLSDLTAVSQTVLLHNAAISACDAVLQATGLRVTPGDRSHILRLETALDQIEADTAELLERLDAARERRNEASYAAGLVAEASLDDARQATAELVELARRHVAD
jgi:hypothetical protein